MDLAIQIKNLEKSFKKGFWRKEIKILKGVSLSVPKGAIFGFIGANGSGKSTTIKCLLNIVASYSGDCQIFGESSKSLNIRKNIGFMPERPFFYEHLKGRELLRFYSDLLGIQKSKQENRIDSVLEMVHLRHAGDQYVGGFSKGMLQRIGIAHALLNDPDLVIFDEPMSGLDPEGRKDVRDIIQNINQDGKTVFFSSHILHDVESVCSHIAYIHDGQIKSCGPIEEILNDQGNRYEIIFSSQEKLSAKLSDAKKVGSHYHLEFKDKARSNEYCQEVIQSGGTIIQLTPRRSSLEEIFFKDASDEV